MLAPLDAELLTRMTSKGLRSSNLRLYLSTAISPLSATSILWPATSRSLTASFWLTTLSSASRMLSTVSLTVSPGCTWCDSRAGTMAFESSCMLRGVV